LVILTLSLLMPIKFDDERYCGDFIRLNEQWISEYFCIEDADRRLAADPFQIVRNGGHILSLVEEGVVVGVCALINDGGGRYQLARMAVHPSHRGKGYGDTLINAAIKRAEEKAGWSLYLLSNTSLGPAISLYRKHGFKTLSEGQHPVYARCNIVMELQLSQNE
jgi:putative acetyltransferase